MCEMSIAALMVSMDVTRIVAVVVFVAAAAVGLAIEDEKQESQSMWEVEMAIYSKTGLNWSLILIRIDSLAHSDPWRLHSTNAAGLSVMVPYCHCSG